MPTIYNTVGGLDGWIQHSTSTGAGGSWNATHDAATGTTADSNDSLTNESIGARGVLRINSSLLIIFLDPI